MSALDPPRPHLGPLGPLCPLGPLGPLGRRGPLALVAVGLPLLAACSPPADDSNGSETGWDTPEEHGAALYEKYCTFCHGATGQGYEADNANALSNESFLAIASDEFLATSIRYGRPGTSMSAWGEEKAGPLDEEEIEHLVAFIRSWQTGESLEVDDYQVSPDATVQRGETYYNVSVDGDKCVDCHGEQGKGGDYMTLENPWFLTEVSDGYLRESIVNGRPGTMMPAYGEIFDSMKIDDLITLIRSWEREPDSDPLPPFDPDLSDAVINPGGPDPGFEPFDGRFLGVDTVKAALDDGAEMILLDARPHADYVEGHLAGAVSIPFFDLEKVIDELPTDVWIINYCGCPHAVSGQSYDALDAAGFTKIAVLDEGYYEWVARGYPIEEGE